ncbi:uncharacterized protein LOC130993760 [Salvia miltiorrhiza]|uniref:uncharacterized protein LOC130993760 n=1 Tax=Salvia miltiorrhiza TaxID=226208 RepID=UPI0025AC054B|nr:uncharacterized protein LOC130993760 [Salvia miltiorrhiza]
MDPNIDMKGSSGGGVAGVGLDSDFFIFLALRSAPWGLLAASWWLFRRSESEQERLGDEDTASSCVFVGAQEREPMAVNSIGGRKNLMMVIFKRLMLYSIAVFKMGVVSLTNFMADFAPNEML